MSHSIILGIESSCDETAAALVKGGKLLSHTVATQAIHAIYGGVFPEVAARAHEESIIPVVDTTLKKGSITIKDITKLAVTQGPGLLGSLLVGIAFANGLKMSRNIPIVGIHHTRAHILANLLEEPYPPFPCLGLVVSGGHTQLIHVHSPQSMKLLGSTLDDAVGEAFDKVAKMMGMPYPGGVHIDCYAQHGDPTRFHFPRTKVPAFNFSFSGVKTSFLYFLRKKQAMNPDFVAHNRYDLCASIQAALVEVLVAKVCYAMKQTNLKHIALGGGVANNRALQHELRRLADTHGWQLYIPAAAYCTDNAAMIAITGYYTAIPTRSASEYIKPFPRMPL